MKRSTLILSVLAALVTSVLVTQAQVPGVNSTLQSVFALTYDNSTMKPTYSMTATFTPASAATDACVLRGSATKNIRVRRVLFAGLATAAVTEPVSFVKRSAGPAGGTGQILVPVSYDSANTAVTADPVIFTANPTVGTAVGTLADPFFSFGNLTTGGAQSFSSQLIWGNLGQPIVLRGIAESVSVNLNAITIAGLQISCTFEWTEE